MLTFVRPTILATFMAFLLPVSAAIAQDGPFPFAIEHAFGSTTIAQMPQPIAAVG